ncbi:hypothetical protein HPB50_019508 [Hyalomma asiaticum]|uniref:Uncharacterized protein n=1 Tax=Hyalomma asiaticum TaxID=266040 RepID=A0ACB7S0R9_HYAAI|nr:hypothetical protein HPB50_019508 [Hyalomma asiaticum]
MTPPPQPPSSLEDSQRKRAVLGTRQRETAVESSRRNTSSIEWHIAVISLVRSTCEEATAVITTGPHHAPSHSTCSPSVSDLKVRAVEEDLWIGHSLHSW